VRVHRLAFLLVGLGCVAVGVFAPSTGCNGTGVTPMCDFPDGANDPEAGCGEVLEGSVPFTDDVATGDVSAPVDASGKADAGTDATQPVQDSSAPPVDAHPDAHEDGGDAHVADAKEDAKG
jgi:hypothetical protein